MAENKLFVFGTGQSTQPEIEALLKAFPPEQIAVGWEITDEEIASALSIAATGTRFVTVCNAWKKTLVRDHRIQLKRRKNTGYYRPTSAEVLHDTTGALRHSEKTLRNQGRHVSIIKPVNALETAQQEHQLRFTSARILDLRKTRMNILPATVAAATPRIEPPKPSETASHKQDAIGA